MTDDDLPVLTQVLRTGSGRREASIPPPDESPDDALDVRPVEETWMAEQLVLGNGANRLVDDDPMQSSDGVIEPHVTHEASGSRTLDPRVTPVPREAAASLALRVREAVLDDLRTRIDTELDARIAQAMHAEVETALAQLQINLRAHLSEALRDVVQRAVDEEIARLTAPARPDDAP